MSTYRKVKRAMTNWVPWAEMFQSRALRVCFMGWNYVMFVKRAKREFPSGVSGKYVMDVPRLRLVRGILEFINAGVTYGHERIETRAMPKMKAYLTLKAMR